MSFFEEQLILHASPVISNIKASNMFSIPIEQASVVRDDFCMYCKLLSKKGFRYFWKNTAIHVNQVLRIWLIF